MSAGLRRLAAATAGAVVIGLTLGSTAPAYAQLDGIDTSSLGLDEVEMIGSVVGSVGVGSLLGSIGPLGSSNFPLDGAGSQQELKTPPRPRQDRITETKFVGITKAVGEYEYWLVESGEMQREVIVEVLPSQVTEQGPAPVLYMLDGVDSPEGNSGYRRSVKIDEILRGENVHMVAPTGAYSAYWSDWESEDPVLGYNKWETFLTEELPGIVESQLAERGTPSNGHSAVGGVSMGGQAAMHLAATHPDLYQGVMSISGYYSTTDELGYQSVRGAVEGRGGTLENMWGPRGSDRWKDHDTISHVQGLEDTAVYFSAGNPKVGPADIEEYGDDYLKMTLGLLLEAGVRSGTEEFQRALERAGIDHLADYADTGFHNWHTFVPNIKPGWDYIKQALY